jgi:hypothetical protein
MKEKGEEQQESRSSVSQEAVTKETQHIMYRSFYKLVPRVKNTPRSYLFQKLTIYHLEAMI